MIIQDIQNDDEIGFIWKSDVRYAIIRCGKGGYTATGNPERRQEDYRLGTEGNLYEYIKTLAHRGEMKQLFKFKDQDTLFKWMEDGKTT